MERISLNSLHISSYSPLRRSASAIFAVLVIFLMLFPFINTFNQFLVKIIEPVLFLGLNEEVIIPYEARLVKVLLGFLSVPTAYSTSDSGIITLVGKTGGLDPIAIAWNCLGWQSLVLILSSIFVGLRGKFTMLSKLEALFIGLMITFWLNIFRLTAIFYLYYHYNRDVAMIFHNWGAIVITIVWLVVFWWFAFRYVLETKRAD